MSYASIVVPAFNAAATLPETLNALSAQSFGDFEIIVVDDGSSDRTVAVARSLGDRRIRVVQQPNRGLAGARNSGIAQARGEYIGFCDADDLWRPTKLAEHVAHLNSNPVVGLSFSGQSARAGSASAPEADHGGACVSAQPGWQRVGRGDAPSGVGRHRMAPRARNAAGLVVR